MNWRERLDARIDRCDGCDEWRWDRLCIACTTPVDDGLSVVVGGSQNDDYTTLEVA